MSSLNWGDWPHYPSGRRATFAGRGSNRPARIWISCSALSPGRKVVDRGGAPVSGTQKLLARIKALFEPSRPAPPAPEAEAPLISSASAPEPVETYPTERPPLFEESLPAEEFPTPDGEEVAVAVEVPAPSEEARTASEDAPDDQPMAGVARPGGLTLRLESERGSRSTFEVTKSGATIGRGPESTIQLADLSVSRKHARITYKQGSYWLSDLGSMGGTWIDGMKLAAPRRVAAGQIIDIGVCRLTVVAAAEGEKTGAAKGPSNAA